MNFLGVPFPKSAFALLTAIAFIILYFQLSHEGLTYADDVGYSKLAVKVWNGTFNITEDGRTFIHRLVTFVPVALLYWAFGVNYLTYTLWSLICTIGCVAIVFWASKNRLESVFSLILISLNFYFLYFVNFLYPDNIVAFFGLATAALYYSAKSTQSAHLILKGIAFTTCLFTAYLSKETAVFVLPFFVISAIHDWFHQKYLKQFWKAAFMTAILIGSFYLLYYYIETGDPFFRHTELEKENLVYNNHVTDPNRSYFKRLTWEPIFAIISTGTFIPVVLMFGGKSKLNGFEWRHKIFWTLLFLSGFIALWFSSTSYKVYNPITLDARMYNLLLPPLAIAASIGIKQKLLGLKYTISYAVIFLGASLLLQNSMSLVYGALAGYFTVHSAVLHYKKLEGHQLILVATISLVLILAIRPFYFMLKPKTLFYHEHQVLMHHIKVKSNQESINVYMPHYLRLAVPYYFSYDIPTSINFLDYCENSVKGDTTSTKYLIINKKLNTTTAFKDALTNEIVFNNYKIKKLIMEREPLQLFSIESY